MIPFPANIKIIDANSVVLTVPSSELSAVCQFLLAKGFAAVIQSDRIEVVADAPFVLAALMLYPQ